MYDHYYPDYLMHYGVKGMKWGVRRAINKQTKRSEKLIKEWDDYSKKHLNDFKQTGSMDSYKSYLRGKAAVAANMSVYSSLKTNDLSHLKNKKEVYEYVSKMGAVGISIWKEHAAEQLRSLEK